jgi:hypothetical protein
MMVPRCALFAVAGLGTRSEISAFKYLSTAIPRRRVDRKLTALAIRGLVLVQVIVLVVMVVGRCWDWQVLLDNFMSGRMNDERGEGNGDFIMFRKEECLCNVVYFLVVRNS